MVCLQVTGQHSIRCVLGLAGFQQDILSSEVALRHKALGIGFSSIEKLTVKVSYDCVNLTEKVWHILVLQCISAAAPSAFDCDFETNLCSWTQDPGDDFDWTRIQGSTASAYTGPQFDHTTLSIYGESQSLQFASWGNSQEMSRR